jgi:predicted ester cyclase
MAIASTLEENKRIARRVPEEINSERRLDLIDEVFAEDAVEHGGMEDVKGREALKAMFKMYHDAYDDARFTVEDIFAEGDRVAMRVRIRAKHTGEFFGIAPTNKSVDFTALVISRIEDGMIAERWALTDAVTMLRQLDVDRIPAM